MWNPDNNEKKKVVSLPTQTVPTVNLLNEKELFKFTFLNSTLVRRAYGFEKKEGKLELVNDTWIKNTVDVDKIGWITEIVIEYNKNNKG